MRALRVATAVRISYRILIEITQISTTTRVMNWIVSCVVVLALIGNVSASASFYVPQAGPVVAALEGTAATKFFRICPNNDGGGSLSNNARIKVTVLDALGLPVPGVAAADIYVLFNGGTAAQGFTGSGADSVIANSAYNFTPPCPDVRLVTADAPTDLLGVTYITFAGADPLLPGVARRDPNRKWGHYDSELPVYVLGVQVPGQMTTLGPPVPYVLRIKNFDCVGGLLGGHPQGDNQGESVSAVDFNVVVNEVLAPTPSIRSYWLDFDWDGVVGPSDFNLLTAHVTHNCDTPTP